MATDSTVLEGKNKELAGTVQAGFAMTVLSDLVQGATADAKTKLATLQNEGSTVSIANMFDMQLLMNRLSQLSEMSSTVMSAAHTTFNSMTRNVK